MREEKKPIGAERQVGENNGPFQMLSDLTARDSPTTTSNEMPRNQHWNRSTSENPFAARRTDDRRKEQYRVLLSVVVSFLSLSFVTYSKI